MMKLYPHVSFSPISGAVKSWEAEPGDMIEFGGFECTVMSFRRSESSLRHVDCRFQHVEKCQNLEEFLKSGKMNLDISNIN